MLKTLLITCLLAAPIAGRADPVLLMAEETGCVWCARWNAEIGPIYPRTAEGRAAPLVRYDIRADKPEVEFKRRVHFTPTFILVEDGKELGRIEGYPGEDFFWGLLGIIMKENDISLDEAG